MARTAQQPVVVQSALAAAVGDGDNVVCFPQRPRGAPSLSPGAIRRRRSGAPPLAVCPDHVESARLADPFVALLHFAAHVPGAAANLPFVHARVAAEGPPGRRDDDAAPAADRLPLLVAVRNTPLV